MTNENDNKYAWIYLFKLGFYILPMIMCHYALWEIVTMVVVMLLFVALYFQCYKVGPQNMGWPLLGMFVLASVITPMNSGSIALFSYVGFFIAFAYSWKKAIALLLGVLATLTVFHFGPGTHWDLFLHYGVVIVLTVSLFGRVERIRQRHRLTEQRSQEEIERLARSIERERIARDLHDILGHTLSSIILKSDLAEKQLQNEHYDAAKQQLRELSQIARSSLSQVRQSVSGYRHGGLNLELERLELRLHEAGFATKVHGTPPTLEGPLETAIALVLTELVTNIIRHSAGQTCHITFDEHEQTYSVQVVDDGECTDFKAGNGLQGVKERIQLLGGKVNIDTATGYLVNLEFPKVWAMAEGYNE